MADLIDRGDALAMVQYCDDKVEGIRNLPAADVVPRELLTASEVARADLWQRLAAEMQKCEQINEGAVMLTKKLNDALEELARYKDAAPVVHGRWEWREEWETHHETRSCDLISCGWYCSDCGIELGDYLTKGTGQNIILDLDIRRPTLAVCPNCGAKMDGGYGDG